MYVYKKTKQNKTKVFEQIFSAMTKTVDQHLSLYFYVVYKTIVPKFKYKESFLYFDA